MISGRRTWELKIRSEASRARASIPVRASMRLLIWFLLLLGLGWGMGALLERFATAADLRIMRSLDGAPAALTNVMRAATELGGLPVLSLAAALSIYMFARGSLRPTVIRLSVVFLGTEFLVRILKVVVGRSRPHVVTLVSSSGLSFPSGHAARAAAIYGAIALVWTRRTATRRRRTT